MFIVFYKVLFNIFIIYPILLFIVNKKIPFLKFYFVKEKLLSEYEKELKTSSSSSTTSSKGRIYG